MAEQIFLADHAKLIIVLHAITAIVLAGSSTHLAVLVAWEPRLRSTHGARMARIQATVTAVSYLTTYVLGLLAYPTFRYKGRVLNLDPHAPWAANLFDMKENFASLGLPLAMGALLLTLLMDPLKDCAMRPGQALATFGTLAIVWFNVVAGLVVGLAAGGL